MPALEIVLHATRSMPEESLEPDVHKSLFWKSDVCHDTLREKQALVIYHIFILPFLRQLKVEDSVLTTIFSS